MTATLRIFVSSVQKELEERGSLYGLLGNLVLVAGGCNAEPVPQELHQRRAYFLLQFDHVAEALVLGAVCVKLCE